MSNDDQDRLVEQRLHQLADAHPAPVTPVADDVARGRRRLRRQRSVVTIGTAAVVGAVALASVLTAGGGDTAGDSTPPIADVISTPTAAPHPAPTALPSSLTASDAAATVRQRLSDHSAVLRLYNDVLAEHLDPGRQHLAPYSKRTGNEQGSTRGDVMTSLGSKFAWTVAGQPGLGMLQVSVSTVWDPDSMQLYCDGGCRPATGPRGEKARVLRSDGSTTVALEHADGQVVVLTADNLFGNNSTVPVSGTGLTVQQLLAAAADERLSLP